ncbi:MAG: 16S rRNA (guanine(527)-N(7))-methyltransferase RsmG [Burkholderiaceae bacterium]|jgi:16S rRNA (guanine527-N7)-methyltransferase|nr:16S rRNA (guanine(527)-N(7))-methyltransferase RsmG [Burkholderiaceae bacterium]
MNTVNKMMLEKPFFDFAHLESMLVKGSQAIGVAPDELQIRQFLSYLTLLSRWNTVYNLTAIRTPEEMMTHHVLDSLAVAPTLKEARHVLDVGSGAGLPGIVLAILYPEMQVSLIDAVQKKTAFLSQVKAELRLKNVMVYTGRVEKLRATGKFDAIISRAFSDLSLFVELSGHLLAEGGCFYAMKGMVPKEEIQALPAGLKVKAVVPLKVPFLDAERHLLILKKQAA